MSVENASVPPRKRRTKLYLAAGALILLVGLGLLVKGTGLKTRLVWLVFGKPPESGAVRWFNLMKRVELPTDPNVQFERFPQPSSSGPQYTCLRFGPDGRLYAATLEGQIFRFDVSADGTLGQPVVFSSLQEANHAKRILLGFAFDPGSTSDQPVLWCANDFFGFKDVPDWAGKITRISGKDLSAVEDVIINLPRSVRDHMTNQPGFGPDGALYIPQGCNTAYGAADPDWGNRPERLLNGCVLRLDVKKIIPGKPLDAKTKDGGGTYDPFAPGAPLTIYACGVRNAYSLVWTTDGRLYVPVNGSSAGGNSPAGPGVPGLEKIPDDEDDWLFHVTPGPDSRHPHYYGHPNPQLGHYVLNGGNPGGPRTPATVVQYPQGTKPDPDWVPSVYDFGPHVSADGVVEYIGNAFDGRLNHALIVCRFNAGSDLCCVLPNGSGEYTSALSVGGSENLVQPLDVTEDLRNGNLYVSEYGGKCITLLRPMSQARIEQTMASRSHSKSTESSAGGRGGELFNTTCIACHGMRGQGIPNLGANLQQSKFIAQQSDDALVEFIRTGRVPGDPKSVLNLTMPPRGGNPSLSDSDLREIVRYLRTLQSGASLTDNPTTQPVAQTR